MKKLPVIFILALILTSCNSDTNKPETTTSIDDDKQTEITSDDNLIAVVNGMAIPENRISAYSKTGEEIDPQRRKLLIDNIIASEIIYQVARREGLAENDTVRQQLVVAEQAVLGRAYASRFLDAHPISNEEIKIKYDELSDKNGDVSEYDTAHILVKEEEKAKKLLETLKKSPDKFAELAKENSQDPGSATNGGKLGWGTAAGLVPPFAKAMQETAKGEIYPQPVKTQFGWHIIQVIDIRKREASLPPLDDKFKNELRRVIRAEKFSIHLEELREKATVEIR